MKGGGFSPGTEYRVINAALDARDVLRGQIVPAIDRLGALVGENPEARAILRDIRNGAARAADRLRFAIKNRGKGARSK